MAQIQSRRYCRECGRKTLHSRSTFGDGTGCLLSVVTLGLFIPVWILIGILEAFRQKWRCQACGSGRYL